MNFSIDPMKEGDRQEVLAMMKPFYASDAVSTNGSDEIFSADFEACVGENPNLFGYVIRVDDVVAGYGMVAKSFSTEFGRPSLWIEDIYFKEAYRRKGLGKAFFAFLEKEYPGMLFRLELEPENEAALALYQKRGFSPLPYLELKKINDEIKKGI